MSGPQHEPLTSLTLVPFSDVLVNVAHDAHTGLQDLAERLPGLGDEERKRALLQHLQTTRQRLQRLHVCAQWAHKAKAVNTCREVLKAAADHGAAFVHTADEFFRLHEELRFGRAPLFDVPTALHILQTGTYRLLPAVIEEELVQPGQRLERPGELDDAARAARRTDALRRLDFLLRSKLLAAELPPGLRVVRVRDGQAAVVAAGGQYAARLTLVPSPRDEVVLGRYRPPAEADDAAAAPKEEAEVTQPAGDAAAAAAAASDQPSTSAAAAAAARASSSAAAEQQRREGPEGWRWQLLSFELLPAAAGFDPQPLLPHQRTWLQQNVERSMWAAADVEQLVRLGKQAWVTVPRPASASKEPATAGAASTAPAPSSSQAPSQLPADSKGKQQVKGEPQEQPPAEQQQGEEAEQQQLPAHATSPLAAMHGILCQTAGRLAVFSLLLSDARQLEGEGGSWRGRLKLSRAAGGSGIRLAYWQQQPCVSHAELQCLREGAPYRPEQPSSAVAPAAGGAAAAAAATAAAQQQVAPTVEAALQEDGTVAVSSSPQLQHPLTGEALQLALPLDRAASFSADRLLLQAAAHSAATQLAAVQAVLQRAGRLEAAGVHTELALASSPTAHLASEQLAASPSLQLWHAGGLQLSLSVQLRTGRLLLAAAPALLESEQGPAAAAAAEAAQQQLDKLQRDAMAQPLPQGCSRGMLAARLMAEALTRVSLQLSLQRRMDAAAAAAAAQGLRRATLPPQLQRVALLVAPLSTNLLTLALPTHPPPTDLAQWARERQQRRQQSGSVGDSGATRCFVLLDFGETAAAAGEQQQQQQQQQPALRVMLAVCACTSRGTATRVLQLTELPPELMREMQQAAAGEPAPPAGPSSRKRRASDAAAEPDGSAGAAGAAAGGEAELGLAAAVAWCKRQAGWAALHAQLQLLPAQHAAECSLTAPLRQNVRLPKLPSLALLDAWAAARLAGGGSEQPPAPKPAASLELEEGEGPAEAQAGAWRVDLSSRYFARLRPLLQQLGVGLAPPAPDAQHMAATEAGLALRYSLQQGHSVLTAVTDLSRLGMVHACLARLASAMAANPLAAAAAAAHGNGGSNGSLDGLDGSAAKPGETNGALPSNGGASAHGSLVWPLPGCGSARLLEAGLTHLVLLVSPPPLPEGQEAEQGQQQPVRVTVSWVGSHATQPQQQPQQQQQPKQQQQQQPQAANGKSDSSGGSDGALRLSRCRVTAEPPLLEPVAAALAQQLEAGRADLFLDSLCLAAHSAAAAAQQLAPEAQRAAGLLPGALQLAPAGVGSSSALRVRAQVQQGGRGVALALGFCAAGYALLQAHPTPGCSAGAAAWLPQLWQQLQQQAPSFAPVDAGPAAAASGASLAPSDGQQAPAAAAKKEPQLLQAWVHRHGLAQALAALLQAVAAPGS